MFPRLIRAAARAVAVITGCVVALLGLVITSVAVLAVLAVIAIVVGPLAAMSVHSAHPDSGLAVRVGGAVSAVMIVAGLVIAGLVVLLGAVAVLVVVPLVGVGGIWVWHHKRSWLDRAARAPTTRPTQRPAGCKADQPAGERTTAAPTPHRSTPLGPLNLPHRHTATVSMPVLCAAWQRTYWLLCDLPPASPDRLAVVGIRAELLDEFERRDPAGLNRWLHTQPRAGSDPGRYLTPGH